MISVHFDRFFVCLLRRPHWNWCLNSRIYTFSFVILFILTTRLYHRHPLWIVMYWCILENGRSRANIVTWHSPQMVICIVICVRTNIEMAWLTKVQLPQWQATAVTAAAVAITTTQMQSNQNRIVEPAKRMRAMVRPIQMQAALVQMANERIMMTVIHQLAWNDVSKPSIITT